MRDRLPEVHTDAQLTEILRQAGDHQPRVHRQFRCAPQATFQALRLNRSAAFDYAGRIQPFAFIAHARGDFGEFAQHLGFIVMIGHMQRSGGKMRKPRCLQDLQPDLAATERHAVHLAGGLAHGPDHSEIPDGGAGRRAAAFA